MFKKLLRKIFYNPYVLIRKSQIRMGNSILTKNFDILNYQEIDLKEKVLIGEGNILSCNIIFESLSGYVNIGNNNFIGGNTKLISASGIDIGNNVTIAWGVTIYDHNSHSLDYRERILDQERQLKDWYSGNFIKSKDWSVVSKKQIVIDDNAWIGFDSVILKGVKIGKGSVVGARSVVTKDVPPWTVVAGNPARVVKKIECRE